MQVGEIVFIIALNCVVIFVLYFLQKRSLEKRIKYLKNEVRDLEDLVVAIIEEFEEIAEMNEDQNLQIQNSDRIVNSPEDASLTEKINQNATNDDSIEEKPMIEDEELVDKPTIENKPIDLESNQVAPPQSSSNRLASDPKHQRILDLWDEGVAIADIAKQLGTGRGEIQLVLGIYRRG